MLELLMLQTTSDDVIQNLLTTNDVGQPSSVNFNWCRGVGNRSNFIYVLNTPDGVTSGQVNLYSYDINTNVWEDLGLTPSISRLNYYPSLTASDQNTLVYMAYDINYTYNINTKVWTLKKVLPTTISLTWACTGHLYDNLIYKYGYSTYLSNRYIIISSYSPSSDTYTGLFTASNYNANSNQRSPTVLVNNRIYFFAINGVVSYYDISLKRVIYLTISIPTTINTVVLLHNNQILIIGDTNSSKNVRLFDPVSNTSKLLTSQMSLPIPNALPFIDSENVPNFFIGTRLNNGECNIATYDR